MTSPPANRRLSVRNRARTRPIQVALLRRLLRSLVADLLGREHFDLGMVLIDTPEMIRLNETYLRHQGPTDVIAFDYSDPATPHATCGEIFVCVEEALVQARRFHVTWQSEIVRYVTHGVLHLCGYDDKTKARRRQMKRLENRLVRELAARFHFREIGRRALVVR